jgi:hypothetical protein
MAGTSPAMTTETHCFSIVMPGPVQGIHVSTALQQQKAWMAGHSRPKDGVLSHAYVPAMTIERQCIS